MHKFKKGFTLNKQNKSKGFTLIELLVVIAIIGILAAIILIAMLTIRDRGKSARIRIEMDEIRKQAMIYEDNHQGFWETPPANDPNVADDPEIIKVRTDIENLGATVVWGDIQQTAYAVTATNLPAGGDFCVDSTTKGIFYSGSAPGDPTAYTACPAAP